MRMNGFGYALRDTGQRRVPAPPERITGINIFALQIFAAVAGRLVAVPPPRSFFLALLRNGLRPVQRSPHPTLASNPARPPRSVHAVSPYRVLNTPAAAPWSGNPRCGSPPLRPRAG